MAVVAAVEDDCCLDTTMYVPAFAADAEHRPGERKCADERKPTERAVSMCSLLVDPVEGYL
jgi:hypothetical protein